MAAAAQWPIIWSRELNEAVRCCSCEAVDIVSTHRAGGSGGPALSRIAACVNS